jgi:elongation factor Ts
MAEITASMVKELREQTGLGMMECKKALTESDGDLKKAEDLLRIKSGAKATKAAGRIAAEGVIGSFIGVDGKLGALLEVNCETDFVAKSDDFLAFAKEAAKLVAEQNPADVAALSNLKLASGQTVEEARKALVMKLGENMTLRRMARFETAGKLSVYLHGTKIGVMVDMQGGDEQLGKDLAMHIAASKPICVSKEQVSSELLAKEREIYTAQAAESGKPANIVEKMVDGRVLKYLAEITLLGQPFVKNPDETVEKLLASKNAKVNTFQMFIVGEGIEKKVVDFAAEVAAAGQV